MSLAPHDLPASLQRKPPATLGMLLGGRSKSDLPSGDTSDFLLVPLTAMRHNHFKMDAKK